MITLRTFIEQEQPRINAALAAQADTVTRIFCGLPLELKG